MILGKDIRLRAVEPEDLPFFVRWLNDPEVIEFLDVYVPLSIQSEQDWFEGLKKRPQEEHPLSIEVNTPEGWRLIGNIAFHHIETLDRCAEVGLFIGEKEYWNRGYGRKALQLMLRHGFKTLNFNRIFLNVFASHLRGIRSYEKAGFIHEGRLRQVAFRDGHYEDMLIMSVLRDEWQEPAE